MKYDDLGVVFLELVGINTVFYARFPTTQRRLRTQSTAKAVIIELTEKSCSSTSVPSMWLFPSQGHILLNVRVVSNSSLRFSVS